MEEDDTFSLINDMLSGRRTERIAANYGPLFGHYSESRPTYESLPWEGPPTPDRSGTVGLMFPAGDMRGIASVTGQSGPGGGLYVYPNVGVQAGPLNFRAGLEHYRQPDYSHTRPNFGAGFGVPLNDKSGLGGDISVTPGYSHSLGLNYSYRPDAMSVISALLRHSQPHGERGETEFGVRYGRKF